MRVRCVYCWRQYSDTRQSFYCPHEPFEVQPMCKNGERVTDGAATVSSAPYGGMPSPDSLWMHFRRRHVYRVVCVALDDDTGVHHVVVQGLHDGRFWTRTLQNFNGERDGMKRFTYVGQHRPG